MTKNQQIIEALFFVSTVPLEQKDINKYDVVHDNGGRKMVVASIVDGRVKRKPFTTLDRSTEEDICWFQKENF